MSLKELIAQDLLDAAGDPVALQQALDRHKTSKGPLYAALGEVTAHLEQQLRGLGGEVASAQAEVAQLDEHVREQTEKLHGLGLEHRDQQQRIAANEARLAEQDQLLARARGLEGRGFGDGELALLHERLAAIAASSGAQPQEAVAQFFELVGRYEHIVTDDVEAVRAQTRAAKAKAEAERWEAEARQREASTKARSAIIDVVEHLLRHGVKQVDVPRWSKILEKAGETPDHLAKELERCGSLEALRQSRSKAVTRLQDQIAEATDRLKVLKAEQARTRAAIAVTRDAAVGEMEQVAQKALGHLEELLRATMRYGILQREAATLEDELETARALKVMTPEAWTGLPRALVQRLLLGLIYRARAMGQTLDPGLVRKVSTSLVGARDVPVANILAIVLAGSFTPEEMLAAGGLT